MNAVVPVPFPLSALAIAEHCFGQRPPVSLRDIAPTGTSLRRWMIAERTRCIPPTVVGPLHAGARAVAVTGLRSGASVKVLAGSQVVASVAAGLEPSAVVPLVRALATGEQVTVEQRVGASTSARSAPLRVARAGALAEPRVLGPLTRGDTEVVVGAVTPGATVTVRAGGRVIGSAHAAEPVARVPVSAVTGTVTCDVVLAGQQRTSGTFPPRTDPGAPGPSGVTERDVDYGSVDLPRSTAPNGTVDGGYRSPLRGRLYAPTGGSGARPLVLVAHGMWYHDEEDQSSLGYAWLARHLAAWGMFVVSLDLSEVNRRTASGEGGPEPATQQAARASLMLAMLDRLTTDPDRREAFDRGRIGLVGHSMSGEAVVLANALNAARPQFGFGIGGVVSLAPTNWRPDVALTGTSYLQLHGSLDYLLGGYVPFNGFRVYDRAWRERTHVFVVGGRHQGWNPNWWSSQSGAGEGEQPIEGSLEPDEHAEIGRTFVNAFFQDALFGRSEYGRYLAGPGRPARLAGFDLRIQHHVPSTIVIDDFGDADDQLGLAAESPPDKRRNRRGGAATARAVARSDEWDDVEASTSNHAVHDSRVTDLRWMRPGTIYETTFGPVAGRRAGALSLRVAQHYDEDGDGPVETWNPVGLDTDMLVELRGGGVTATVRAGAIAPIAYPAPAFTPLSVPRTIRIPLDSFVAAAPGFDIGAIDRVRLHLVGRLTGRLLIDDIELTST